MKCLILAAGYATRLYPLTENFPKPLLKVGDKTILDWLVDDVASTAKADDTASRAKTDEIVSMAKGDEIISMAKEDDIASTVKVDEIISMAKVDDIVSMAKTDNNPSTARADDVTSTAKVDGFVVISNHKFAHYFQEWAALKQEQIHIPVQVVDDGTDTNETRLGAVRDILFALEQTGIREDLLIMAGDNVLDFSLEGFLAFAREKGTSCVMCHEEHDLAKLRKTAVITFDRDDLITSYEEKPAVPKGFHAVPPFYYYKAEDAARIPEALQDGCGADAPGSFAAWLSEKTQVHAWEMAGKRYDIGNLES